jgi:hypothetical protein
VRSAADAAHRQYFALVCAASRTQIIKPVLRPLHNAPFCAVARHCAFEVSPSLDLNARRCRKTRHPQKAVLE